MRGILDGEEVKRFIRSLKLDIKNLYSCYSNGHGSIAASGLSQPLSLTSTLSASITCVNTDVSYK